MDKTGAIARARQQLEDGRIQPGAVAYMLSAYIDESTTVYAHAWNLAHDFDCSKSDVETLLELMEREANG